MKFALIAAAMLVTVPVAVSAAPAPMSVATFLGKAEGLKSKGPLALFSGDIKLLMNQVKADSAQLRAENKALEAAGKSKHYCLPEGGKMTEKDIMGAMEAVPAAQRAQTSTKAALRAYIARRHPCRS